MGTPPDVQFYDHLIGSLLHTMEHKARKFLAHNCLRYDSEGKVFLCFPLVGYNTRTYTLNLQEDGRFNCNCQGFRKKEMMGEPRYCSHIHALILAFKEGVEFAPGTQRTSPGSTALSFLPKSKFCANPAQSKPILTTPTEVSTAARGLQERQVEARRQRKAQLSLIGKVG